MSRTLPNLLVLSLFSLSQVAIGAEKIAISPLDGTWKVISAEKQGQPHPDIVGDRAIFAGAKLTIRHRAADRPDRQNTFTLEDGVTPNRIDIKPDKVDDTAPGIYELKGDELKICFRAGDSRRPTEFATTPRDWRATLVVMKRETQQADKDALQGTWKVATGQKKGKQAMVGGKMIFAGDKVTIWEADGKEEGAGTFALDETKTPKTMDINLSRLPDPGRGIYELTGDRLKLCCGLTGGPRPTEFVAPQKESDRFFIIELERQKE